VGQCQLQALLSRGVRNENGSEVRGFIRENQIPNEGTPQNNYKTRKNTALFALFEL
jgi:hypothetical protein